MQKERVQRSGQLCLVSHGQMYPSMDYVSGALSSF